MPALIAIPVRAYAIAAAEAAFLHSELVADIFDETRPSRARFVALRALIALYPLASRVAIAKDLGFPGGGVRVHQALQQAEGRRWWREEDVDAVVRIMRLRMGADAPTPAPRSVAAREPTQLVMTEKASREAQGAPVFIPRKRIYAPQRLVARPVNVTGALLGDPTPEQRAAMAARPGEINAAAIWTKDEAELRRKHRVLEMGL